MAKNIPKDHVKKTLRSLDHFILDGIFDRVIARQ